MKFSTRTRYGLRALIELVGHYGNGALSIRDIAEEQQISRNYLEALFNSLKVAGLLISKRGPGGGWVLTRPPSEITLSDVLRALEGNLGVVDCIDFPGTCARSGSCPTREIYEEVSYAIIAVLDRHNLESLHRRKVDIDKLLPPELEGEDLCSP